MAPDYYKASISDSDLKAISAAEKVSASSIEKLQWDS